MEKNTNSVPDDQDKTLGWDELLAAIEDGDAPRVLQEANLRETFNELLKNELITIIEEKVCLTDRGKEYREKKAIPVTVSGKKPAPQPELKNYSPRNIYLLILAVFLSFALLFLVLVL